MTIALWIAAAMCAGGLLIGGTVAGVVSFKAGVSHRKKVAEAAIGSAETEAERIRKDAVKAAESKKKEALLEAKDEIHRHRSEADREIKERRAEVQRQERHVQQKEESLDRKIENYEKKEELLRKKETEIEDRLRDVNDLKRSQFEMLERISGLTTEQAAYAAIVYLEELKARIGIPYLSETEFDPHDVEPLSKNALTDTGMPENPRQPSLEEVETVFLQAYLDKKS